MQPDMENPATLAACGAPKTDFAGSDLVSDGTKSRLTFQSFETRIKFCIRNLPVEDLSRDELPELSALSSSARAAVDAELHRRLEPSECGTGLLGLLSAFQFDSAKGGAS